MFNFQQFKLLSLLCVTCEKKIVVPVQMCVLSTGFLQLDPQVSAICTSFPSLFPNQIRPNDTAQNCGLVDEEVDEMPDCDCYEEPMHSNDCTCGRGCRR